MKISELKAGDNGISLRGRVLFVGKTRRVNTKYGQRDVTSAILADGSGDVFLDLWGDQIYVVNPGMEIELTGGYVHKWQNKLSISLSDGGEIKVIHKFFIDRKRDKPKPPVLSKEEKERMVRRMKEHMESVRKNYETVEAYKNSARDLRKKLVGY